MGDISNMVCKKVDEIRNEIVNFLATLVKTYSVSPPGDTREITKIIKGKLESFNMDAEIVEPKEGIQSILASTDKNKKPVLLFNSHIDTVSEGNKKNWSRDPFGAQIENGKLYGRGSADAKGSVVGMIMAAKVLHDLGLKLKGNLLLNPVGGEEIGGEFGAKYLVKKGYLDPDIAVIGEITGNKIAIAEKGINYFKLQSIGKSAHASTPWTGNNAIVHMVKFINEIEKRIGAKLKSTTHPLTPPPSINIGMIQGGIKINIVPDFCEAFLDWRTIPGETLDNALEQLEEIINDLKEKDKTFNASIEVIMSDPPINTPPDHPAVQSVKKVYKSLGLQDELIGYEQASDGRFFVEKNIPIIIIGPGIANLAHGPDEYVPIDEVIEATKIYSMIAIETLGLEK